MSVSLQEKQALIQQYGMKGWAHILRLRHQRGEKLNANQIRCYSAALGLA